MEKSLLGTIIRDNSCIFDVIDRLSEEDFNYRVCRDVFEAIKSLYKTSSPVDNVTVYTELKNQGTKSAYVSILDITSICQEATTPTFVDSYINIILKNSLRRKLIEASEEFRINVLSELIDPEQVLSITKTRLDKIEVKHERVDILLPVAVDQALESIKSKYETYLSTGKPAPTGILTGYKELDQKLIGLKPGELHIIAARTGVGKTAFALNLLTKMCIQSANKIKGLFISLEMAEQELVNRLLSIKHAVAGWKMSTGVMTKEDFEKISDTSCFQDVVVSMIDKGCVDISDVRREAKRFEGKHGLDILFLDYLQLMKASSKKSFEARHVEVADITRSLKMLAKELDIPIVALSQLSRNVQDNEKPHLSDLRESGSIEMDADSVMLLYRNIATLPTVPGSPVPPATTLTSKGISINLDLAKHRDGPTGTIQLIYRPECFSFDCVCDGGHAYDGLS